jgi:class 3 adenylate cyclase/tetratricopeptide (TPR) repeat protein
VAGTRKTVTILRCDVTGSTALGEQLDPEALRHVQERYFDEMRKVIERYGGTVEKFIGDAVMAVFGIPHVHEDDSVRAIRAAEGMRDTLERLNEELEAERGVRLEIRTGLTTGEVVAGDPSTGQTFVTGDAANVAARLEGAAQAGEILFDEPTFQLVAGSVEAQPLEPLAVKGKADPLPAWRLLRVLRGAEAIPRRFETPLVGRERELAQLRESYERAMRGRRCELVTILGEPGIGKSRLAGEFTRDARTEATILRGRCLPYGEGITYWPLVEIVDGALEAHGREEIADLLEGESNADLIAARIAAVVGRSDARVMSDEMSWALRKLLERLAEKRPLVIQIDDVQWAESSFLDLVEQLAYLMRRAPILLLCLARSELTETRPAFPGTKIELDWLSANEVAQLMEILAAPELLDDETRDRIEAAAGGNPLYLEQMLAMVQRQGSGRSDVVPPTIQALLGARLDRLGPDLRRVLVAASVVGEEFATEAVRELAGGGESGTTAALVDLVRQGFLRLEDRPHAGNDVFSFAHLLVRDAAYRTIAKELRAELHERLARWLGKDAGGDAHPALIAYHLEQAYRYRSELGPLDDRTRKLGREAAELLADAAWRSWARDLPGIAGFASRALALVPSPDPFRADLLVVLGDALAGISAFDEAEAAFAEALSEAGALGNEVIEARALLGRAYMRQVSRPEGLSEFRPIAASAIAVFERVQDHSLLARAWEMVARAELVTGDSRGQREALARALRHAERAGDHRRVSFVGHLITGAQLGGDTPVAEVLSSAERKLAHAREHGYVGVEAGLLSQLAECRAMLGDFAGARELCGRFEELFRAAGKATASDLRGTIELLAGEPARAEHALRSVDETHAKMGDIGHGVWARALLARALYEQEDDAAAEQLSKELEEDAPEGDLASAVRWRTIRALVLARRGRAREAETLVREALALVDRTDWVNARADVRMDLAHVLAAGERSREAADAVREAVCLYDAKGNIVSMRKARALLEDLKTGVA